MINAIIIIEKDTLRRAFVEKVLLQFGYQFKQFVEANSMTNGLSLLQEVRPELVFLSTQFKNGSGFELLSNSTYQDFELVFLSEDKEDTIEAIRVGALDYLLYPLDDLELSKALQRIIAHFDEKWEHQIKRLLEMSHSYLQRNHRKRITVKTIDTVYAIYEDDIIYCQSDGNYTTIFTRQVEKIIIAKSIKKIEAMLSEEDFIRCHQSYIVNKRHVLRYNKQGMLIFPLNVQVPVSNRKKEMVLKRIFD
ncbi:MAG: LytTR family DNA-binding domain-containing protein [Bacteroidota bacterium]